MHSLSMTTLPLEVGAQEKETRLERKDWIASAALQFTRLTREVDYDIEIKWGISEARASVSGYAVVNYERGRL
jgi:hypothetical protein